MTVLERSLTDNQMAQFERDGFLVLRQMLSPAEVSAIRDTFMAQNADGPVPGLSEIRYPDRDGYSADDPLSFYPRMMHPHTHPELPVGPLSLR